MYNYLFSPHLTRCYGLLRTVLFKLYVFRPYNLSFIVYPSVLDDLPPLVAVASSSSCPGLLRVFNYIVRVSKTVAYLLWGKVHVDFSGSNVYDCFDGAKERSSKDDGWIVLIFSQVNNLQSFRMSDLPSGAKCMSVLGVWFRTGVDRWLRPLCWCLTRCRKASSGSCIH